MSHKILIIEDEERIARFLELELQHEGYMVEKAYNGRTGLEKALEKDISLIVLDVMLPGLNGMEVCRRIRQSSEIPIIMLTAKDATMDKVMGLDTGADDYVAKPFAIEELLARIRAALKRKNIPSKKSSQVLLVNGLRLDLDKHTASYRNTPIELTKKEFDFLHYLMENKNMVLTRDQILERVWGYSYFGDTNVVDVYIRYLRSKIDSRFKKKFIHTVRGVGYILKDE